MAVKRLERPHDPLQLGKLIVDIATGQINDRVEDRRDPAAVALGQRRGKARAATMNKKRRSEIARKAARTRGAKND